AYNTWACSRHAGVSIPEAVDNIDTTGADPIAGGNVDACNFVSVGMVVDCEWEPNRGSAQFEFNAAARTGHLYVNAEILREEWTSLSTANSIFQDVVWK